MILRTDFRTVVAANTDLPSQLETLGSDPYESGWVIRVQPDSVEQFEALMDQEAYDKPGGDEFVSFQQVVAK